jgi:hypothetical protein
MIGFVLINAAGFPMVYGYCQEHDVEGQARDGMSVHTMSLDDGVIDCTVKAGATVRNVDGVDWPIDPPFTG